MVLTQIQLPRNYGARYLRQFEQIFPELAEINDLPLLESVDQPITVNPDPRLAAVAAERGWPRLEWRAAA